MPARPPQAPHGPPCCPHHCAHVPAQPPHHQPPPDPSPQTRLSHRSRRGASPPCPGQRGVPRCFPGARLTQPRPLLSTEKYLPREGGGLAGEGRKGPPAGWKATSSVWAMYWMMSVWWGSRSSWSMLSLAARCLWNCRRLGDPGGRRAGLGGQTQPAPPAPHPHIPTHPARPPGPPLTPTSGVQAGRPLGALQLPLLDPEVGAGPVQAGVATQAGEELQDGALGRGRGGLPGAGTARPSCLPAPGCCCELGVRGSCQCPLGPECAPPVPPSHSAPLSSPQSWAAADAQMSPGAGTRRGGHRARF